MSEATVFNHRIFGNPDFDPSYSRNVELNGGAYALRAYALTRPGDVFLNDPELEAHLAFQRQHFADIGYGPTTETVVQDDSRERTLDYPEHRPSVYYFDKAWADVFAIRFPDQIEAIQRRLRVTRIADDKNEFFRLLVAQGLAASTPDTKLYEAGTPRVFKDAPLPGYLKAPFSSNGIKNERVTNRRDLRRLSRDMVRFQVQQEIPHDLSLSSQHYAENGKVTKQLVTGTFVNPDGSHAGNYTLPPEQQELGALVATVTAPIAEMLAAAGVEGYFGLDVLVARQGSAFVIECNLRPTGGSYPWEMAERTGANQWRSLIIRSSFNDLAKIDLGKDLPYNRHTQTGVILESVGQFARREAPPQVEIWIAAPQEYQQEMEDEARERFITPAGKKMLAKAA